ncbi:EF-hand domain-containing protein [Nocardiopsis sp. CC223A]|uniref:EF-hand domain-containing protein n=1 Tax=Nocardiopsis sp. CC223A TaxID=3044051 RepID=UPI00278C37E2|nr:EF-hand domain-containing protein [Nocardiopsis sp. CC223A]
MTTATDSSRFDRFFFAHDTDSDGHVDWSDYERLVAAYLDAAKADRAGHRAAALKVTFQMWWMELLRHAQVQGQRLSREEYTRALQALLVDTSRFNMLEGLAHAVFDVLDADGDDQIGRDEFQALLRALKVPDFAAADLFHALDTDGDTVLSRHEVVRAVREFFSSPEDNPSGGIFFGVA